MVKLNTLELFKGDRRNSNRRKQSLIESMLDPLALFQAPPQIKEEPIPKRNGVDMNLVEYTGVFKIKHFACDRDFSL